MICVCPTMADTSIDAHFGQEKVPHRQTNPCQTGFDQYPTMIHFSRYQTMADLWRNGTPSPNISEPNPASQCYQTTTPSGVGQHKGLWSNPGCSFQMPIAATCSVLVPCWWILPAHHKNVASWTDRHSMRLLKRLNYDTTKTRIFQCFEMKPASNFCTRFIKPLSDESSALDVQAHVIPEAHEGHFSFTKSCQCETTHRCMFPVHPNTHTHQTNQNIQGTTQQRSFGMVLCQRFSNHATNWTVNIDERVVNCEVLVCFVPSNQFIATFFEPRLLWQKHLTHTVWIHLVHMGQRTTCFHFGVSVVIIHAHFIHATQRVSWQSSWQSIKLACLCSSCCFWTLRFCPFLIWSEGPRKKSRSKNNKSIGSKIILGYTNMF